MASCRGARGMKKGVTVALKSLIRTLVVAVMASLSLLAGMAPAQAANKGVDINQGEYLNKGDNLTRKTGSYSVELIMQRGLAVTAAPAQAGVWVDGGLYPKKSICQAVGDVRMASGQYATYTCTAEGSNWRLRGFMN
jgi:hypothetical protein